jgi:hypothetical protein
MHSHICIPFFAYNNSELGKVMSVTLCFSQPRCLAGKLYSDSVKVLRQTPGR